MAMALVSVSLLNSLCLLRVPLPDAADDDDD